MRDYTDEDVSRYSCYVRRTATLAYSTGAQTLAFRQWFRRTFQMEPGRYIGAVHAQAANHNTPVS